MKTETLSIRLNKSILNSIEKVAVLETTKKNKIITISDYIRAVLHKAVSGSLEK